MSSAGQDVSASSRLQDWVQLVADKVEGLPHKTRSILRGGLLVLTALLILVTVTVPFDLGSQCVFAAACFIAALVLRRQVGRFPAVLLIVFSLTVSLRYMYWRVTSTLAFENWLDMLFGYGLLFAELYALVVLAFGYLQTAWPLRRQPVLMRGPPDEWPTVDVFIPSYNETLDIVKLTVFAAQAIDWPKDKLRVHVLDDGCREEFRVFCDRVGVNYLARKDHQHAKAGNLNAALKVTNGEYIAFFDADHVPTRSFLQICVGWFIKDPKLAILQTPHFFFSPDPFEKNLETFRTVPNEGELFYGLVQDGNDLWNAAFFCGSCAVMRRSMLMEVGGIAVETVTEDAHTALKLNRAGYNTAYLAIPQAAGLATENLSRHIHQRVRWARGMAQIFRVDNPLLGKGLNWGQRLCYLNAMLHFFYGLPRLVFLTAPLAYLFFGAQIFHASALMIVAYALPHILHASLANSRTRRRYRHSFWNEVYETVLAWYIMGPVLMALVNPRFGGFNVTDKGGIITNKYFDWMLARPYIVLLSLNLAGFVLGVWQLMSGDEGAITTILINMAWTIYNIIISSASVAVASETRQIRSEPRVAAALSARVEREDGRVFDVITQDFSQKGLGFHLPAGMTLARGEQIKVTLFRNQQASVFPARVMFCRGNLVGAQYVDLSLRQQSEVVRQTFSRADIWAADWGKREVDTPLLALRNVTLIGMRGMLELFRATLAAMKRAVGEKRRQPDQFLETQHNTMNLKRPLMTGMHARKPLAAVLLLALLANSVNPVWAEVADNHIHLSFKKLGLNHPMSLHGVEASDSVDFSVRADEVVTSARLTLQYAYSPALLTELSHINILVNDEVAASLPLPKEDAGVPQKRTVDIPPYLITEFNRLHVQFIGHYTMDCEDPLHSSLWAKISNDSALDITTLPLALPDDLAILPLPFFDWRDVRPLDLPFVFSGTPDNATLEAAGVLSSWFGAQASYRGAAFTTLIGSLPMRGHSVVFIQGAAQAQIGGLSIPAPEGATLRMLANPNDANGKLLIVAGRDAAELKRAAIALSLGGQALAGDSVVIDRIDTIKPRHPYDAPRWLPTDRPVKLGELIESERLNVSGYNPGDITIALNLPPDLFHWRKEGAPLDLRYRYTPQQASNNSSFIVRFNDRLLRSEVLPSIESIDKKLLKAIKDEELARELRLLLPLNAAALQSRLQLRYMYDYIKEGECRDIIIDNMRGSIDPESTIDLRGYDHFIAMPNLGVFKEAGFPFTRMADLSQTAVVLPDNARLSDLDAYLTVLGYFGKQTGYPSIGITVTQAGQVTSFADKDLLVIASGNNQPLLNQWAQWLPAANGEEQRFELSDLPMRIRHWLSPDPEENLRRTRLAMAFSGTQSSTYLTGFESPLKKGRSVVVIAGGNEQGLAHAINALNAVDDSNGTIQGSLVVVRGKTIEPLVADEQYYVGSLSWFKRVQWALSRNVGWMLLLTLSGILLLGGLTYLGLRAQAKKRMND